MGKNTTRLGSVLSDRMKKTANTAVPLTTEFGTINKNLSLSVDSLNKPIPKGSYMVNLMLAGDSYRTTSATVDGSTHTHALPSGFRALKQGDRVMVIWNGYMPVVVAIIVNS